MDSLRNTGVSSRAIRFATMIAATILILSVPIIAHLSGRFARQDNNVHFYPNVSIPYYTPNAYKPVVSIALDPDGNLRLSDIHWLMTSVSSDVRIDRACTNMLTVTTIEEEFQW
ncbi:MAG TPA: hypothetical protein VGE04_11715, partial [Chloroflexia bacterium]